MIQLKILQQFKTEIFAGFYGKPLNFLENKNNEIPDIQKLNIPCNPVFSDQPHQNKVEVVTESRKYIGFDSFITQEKKLPLLIKVADCIGALLYDPITKTIAVIHAGWRGLAQKVFTKTIQKMSEDFASYPEDIFVALSPSIHLPTDPRKRFWSHRKGDSKRNGAIMYLL